MEQRGQPAKWIWIALALTGLTLLRLWISTRFELIGDEAYYWLWARHLDWCYYSKGPLVAWTIRLGTTLFGDTALGIRCFSVVLGTATLTLLYWLAGQLFSRRIALWTLVLAACTPLFVIGGMLMTIDPLYTFFWVAASCLFWRAKDRNRLWPWLATGALVGLGMLAKYTAIALLPSFALFLLWVKPYRHHLRRRTFWLMCVTALLCLAPPLWWNARHGWITLLHLQERGALDRAWHFSGSEFLEYLAGQFGAYFPLFLAGVLFSLVHGRLRKTAPVAYRFVACLSVPLLVVYSVLALNDAGEANWTAAAVMSALPLLAAVWSGLGKSSRLARAMAWVAIPPAALLAAVILIAPATYIPFAEPLLYRVRGWQDLARQVETVSREEHLAFVIGDHYQTASLLAFYMEGHPDTFIVERPHIQNQYSFWPGYADTPQGQDALYVSRSASLPAALQEQFDTVEPPRDVWSHWQGRPVRRFYLHLCRGYRGRER